MDNENRDPYFIEPTNQHSGSGVFKKTSPIMMVVLIVGVLLALAAVIFMFSQQTGDPARESQVLTWRGQQLQDMLDLGSKYAQSADMQKFNSEASILVAGDLARLQTIYEELGYKKAMKDVQAAESDPKMIEDLTTAGVNGRFDVVYKSALSDQLSKMLDGLNKADGIIKSKKFHETGSAVYSNMETILKRLNGTSTD